MRLMVQVGEACAALANEQMRNLPCRRIEVDEIWAYVGKKQCHVTREDDPHRVGDMWTFVALDPETKLVPSYRVGKRSRANAVAFMGDLSERPTIRVQISSDALSPSPCGREIGASGCCLVAKVTIIPKTDIAN